MYLGIRILLQPASATGVVGQVPRETAWKIYRAGMLTNVMNPKVAMFFMAFLPQFVDASSPSKVGSFLFLGALFMTTGTLWCLVLVWCAAAMSRRLREKPAAGVLLARAAGTMFVGLGARLALSTRP